MTIFELLNKSFAEYVNEAALKTPEGEILSYGEVSAKACKLYNKLKNSGVPDGSVVAILMERGYDYIIAMMTCFLYGYPVVPLDLEYPKERIDTIIEASKAEFVITKEKFQDAFDAAAEPSDASDIYERKFVPSESDVAIYIFTSGSTGKPKGVILDQKCVYGAVHMLLDVSHLKPGDVWASGARFTFIAGIEEILQGFSYGASIVIAPDTAMRDPAILSDFCLKNDITGTFISPRILRYFVNKSEKLKVVFCGSERVSNIAPQNYRLINAYGQSETCGLATFFEVDKAYENTPIGKPAEGAAAYVLDEDGNEAEEGELCLSGHFFSGYLGLPEQTAKVITENPFKDIDGNERMVHTGDIVRRLPDGNLLYLNRKDWMIKINGQRVEPGEIENVIKKSDGVKDAAVKDFTNKYGQKYICAYYVGDEKTETEEIRKFAAERLPDYMVPAFFIKLEELPKNANNKLDRSKLIEPDAGLFKSKYRAPETDVQKLICRGFEKVLGVERIGLDDDFFSMGGDSIRTLELVNSLNGLDVSAADIFKGKTPEGIAKILSAEKIKITEDSDSADEMPLSDSQMGVYLDCLEDPETCKYNIPFVYTFTDGNVNAAKLKEAAEKVLESYSAFSIGISLKEGTPVMKKIKDFKPEVSFAEATLSELEKIKSEFVKPFSFDGSALYRAKVVSSGSVVCLLFDVHHTIYDGTSVGVFERALKAAYEGSELPSETITPFMVSAREIQEKDTEELKECYDYFAKTIDITDLDSNLVPDKDARALKNARGQISSVLFADTEKIESFARKNAVTENTLFAGAYAYALAKYTAQEASLFASVDNGRHERGMENSIGMFVRTFPVYVKIDEEADVRDYLKYVQDVLFGSMAHDKASFAELAKTHGINATVKFVYQGDMFNGFDLDGADAVSENIKLDESMSSLEMMVIKTLNGYRADLGFKKALYTDEHIDAFLNFYRKVIEEFLNGGLLKNFELSDEKCREIVKEFNSGSVDYEIKESTVDRFNRASEKYGDKTCYKARDTEISFKKVASLSDAIAGYLISKNIGAGDFAAILTGRNINMPVSAWGVLKSGAAYQPLDPSYPAERLNFMLKDSGAKLLICDRELRDLVNDYTGDVLYTDELESLVADDSVKLPEIDPQSPFIIIYTSGTTGTPKGCLLSHANLISFADTHPEAWGSDDTSVVAAYASFGFDAGMMDLMVTPLYGAETVIIPDDIRLDMALMDEFFIENGITHSFMTTQVGCMFAQFTKCKTLKAMAMGGEKLIPFKPKDGFKAFNLYGPSETTVYVLMNPIESDSMIQPIGRPIKNSRDYVVDKYDRLLPVGACGELCLAGLSVGLGYYNRPEATGKVFVENPFEPGKKMYRTGDIVRLLPEKKIDFVGRRDGQVKIRGFRIELKEIEQIIREYEGVDDATVQAFDNPAGGKFVAAYVVSKDKINIDDLNAFILENKPPYMVPAVTMQIDRIPLNVNSKVDKRKLPEPKLAIEDIILPETEIQKKLFDIVKEVLGTDELGVNTDFYRAGLTSILSIKLVTLIGDAFDVPLRISDLKENSTILKLEKFIEKSEHTEAAEILEDYPLTKTQMGIYAECMAHPGSVFYNIPVLLEIDGNIDAGRLKKAVADAINAHSYALTTLFTDDKGEVRQRRDADARFLIGDVNEETLKDLDEIKLKVLRPFNLMGGRLIEAAIFTASDTGKKYFLLDIHHIIGDGVSINILIEDISKAYAGEAIKEENYTGFEVAGTEETRRKGDDLEKAKAVYQKLLDGVDNDCTPPPVSHGKMEGSEHFTYMSGENAGKYMEYCDKNGITMSALFNAAFGYTLGKYTFKDDIAYCTVYSGRNDSRLSGIVSMLVKTFPVRCRWDENTKAAEYVAGVSNDMMESMANDIYSFAEISREYSLDADILFTYQGDMFVMDSFCGMPALPIDVELDSAKAPMDLDVVIKDGMVMIDGTFRNDIYSKSFIEHLARSLFMTADGLLKNEFLKDIEVLDKLSQTELTGFNDTLYPVAKESVNKMFERCAGRNPKKRAVFAGGEALTYEELNALSNRTARVLIDLSVKKDEIVGLITERTKEVFIGELGIIKSGAAFLPMVPEYPDERIDFCLKDAGSRFVLTTRKIYEERKELFDGKPYEAVLFDEILEGTCEKSLMENPDISISGDSLCYCIYTSGTTGTPKGVMIEHRNLRNFLDPNPKNPETEHYLKQGSVVLSVISTSFDFSIMETLLPLSLGLSVCMATEDEIHDPIALAKKISEHNVDVMSCTPSFIANMVDIPEFAKALRGMKLYDLGAEAFPKTLYKKLRTASPDAILCNGYGPTEATISCISKVLSSGENITIGKPAANVRAYICDKNMNLVPSGAVGELVIGGEGVGRGYVNLPEKTAAVFVELEGQRAYRTGDLARFLFDGEIEFFGRLDNQVKLRGFRVELDEIENNINDFPGINTSKVVVRNNGSEDYLVGFFTAECDVDTGELKEHLKDKLTYYMVPSVLMQLDEMPLTVNGKIDKKKLPEVEFSRTREIVEPENDTEKLICEIFAEILGLEKVGATESFFEIGGTSLTVTSAVIRLNDAGIAVVYKNIFDYPSAREICAYLEGDKKGSTDKFACIADYDYRSINKVLERNTGDYIDETEKKELGNIILTGASGFLGMHILQQYLDNYDGTLYCLLRKGSAKNVEERMKSMLVYYFGGKLIDKFENRVVCIEGDITDPEKLSQLEFVDADTIINCAALVKHFVNDDSLDRINVNGVKNLIEFCLKTGKRLIQISTTSVGGAMSVGTDKKIKENDLYFGQKIDNDYVRTKFLAERAVLEARAERGLDGQIIRVGNLMSRISDGEFQINFITNSFMRSLKVYKQLGAFPMHSMYDAAEFSPIDSTAAAILSLAASKNRFSVFEAYNNHIIFMADVIKAMKNYGFDIDIVSDEEFAGILKKASGDEKFRDAMLGVLAYASDSEEPVAVVDADNRFTIEVLYRLGFIWPITGDEYLKNVINVLDDFGFFDLTE